MRVIELDPADTIHSVRDRIVRSGSGRVVLVLPARGEVLRRGVDLILLRRLADRERLEVGLVTGDRALARQARALGLPAFATVVMAEHFRPGWWRARPSEHVGFDVYADAPVRTPPLPTSERRPALLGALWVVLAVALLSGVAVLLLPQATITLRPVALPVQAIMEVTADPALPQEGMSGAIVPAHTVRGPVSWEVVGASTGDALADRRRLAAPARQALGTAAPELLGARLGAGEWLIPASVRFEVSDETYTETTGRAQLVLRAEMTGLAVSESDLAPLLARQLAAAVPSGYVPDATTLVIDLEPGDALDSIRATARATARPAIDTSALARTLRGRTAASAARYLSEVLPLAEPPALDIQPSWWRSWFGRLPLRVERIRIELLP